MDATKEGRAAVKEHIDRFFEIPAFFEDGTEREDALKVRPGTSPTRVQLEAPMTNSEYELVDLRRALHMAEEANR